MSNTLRKPPPSMTAADFLAWPGDGTGRKFQLVVVRSTRVLVELLRRGPDGHWPEEPDDVGPGGTLSLQSIGLSCPLSEVYAQTHLGNGDTC